MLRYGDNFYSYNAAGDLTEKNGPEGITTYDYDAARNLQAVTLADGTEIEYLIDGRDRRVGKRVNGQLERSWIYRDQLSPVAQFDGDGNMTHRFVYAEKLHVPSYMIRIDPATGEETEYRIVSDHMGSVRQVIDAEPGVTVQEMDYGPFGQVIADTNPGFQPFGFAGALYDRDTGLVRFGARDYDPEIGRWTAKDLIDFEGGAANLYGYTINDAVNMLEISTLVYFGSQNGYVVMREFIKLLVFIVLFAVAILLIWCFGPLPTSTELVKQLVEWMGRIHC